MPGSKSIQATLQHIKLLEEEIQTKQKRRNELLESGLKGDHAINRWEESAESLDDEIKELKTKRDRAHNDLASRQ